ncbi:universal stress protein [Oceanobacter antarcticus]|jgi:nucleotide-binding universal stress UspA family protein|uniref:Universal stress protein n=1 Tax=Oceanobacter antarcticus TaxID=3133425 RepID=A0ABW8NMR5_9GAMM|tara:strand:+ start:572 stop:1045 length:474 start_codon:yes stop_codon:yes gene_type:complete
MLPEVTRILYASDIQQGARPAFRTAVSLCGRYHSHITFLHVVEPVRGNAERLVKSMMHEDASLQALHDDSLGKIRQQVRDRVERFCREELAAETMLEQGQLDVRIEEGTPWKTILAVADEMDASVIVMGVRHQKSLLGNTSSKVMHNSKRPVLVVPL